MWYIESPEILERSLRHKAIFLAGGITNCPDWQQDITGLLRKTDLILLNPRRKEFPIHDPAAAPAQIEWEFNHLRMANKILFWFPRETLCPIVLYELGAWAMTSKPIYVGIHPDYERRLDVEIQVGLARPDAPIVYSIEALAGQIAESVK